MAEHDGKPDIEDIIAPSEAEGFIAWTKAALTRAVKTAAQSAVAAVGTTAAIGSVDSRHPLHFASLQNRRFPLCE